MASTADAWGVIKSSADPLSESLIKRAMKREVVGSPYPNQWIVLGNPKLSDNYDEYLVKETDPGYAGPETSTYQCDCSTHQYGDVRRRKVCSHITAVILHRQGKLPPTSRLAKVVTNPEPELDFTELAESGMDRDPPATTHYTATGSADRVGGESPPLPVIPTRKPKRVALPSTTFDRDDDDGMYRLRPSQLGLYDPPLPAKFTEFQHQQWETINAIVDAFRDGFKVVFLDAPTGSGKTLVAESVRRMLGVAGIYTCTTKTLQKQVMRDFGSYAKQIMGRKNYSTHDDPRSDLTADDCVKRRVTVPACANCPGGSPLLYWNTEKTQQTLGDIGESNIKKMHCAHCHPWTSCPYEVAKTEASMARLAVLNTAYFLAENIFDHRSPFKNSPLVILDEADRLEEELMGFVEVEIGPRTRKELGVGLPEKKTVDEAWVDWLVDDLTPAITRAKEDLHNQARSEIEFVRRQKSLNRLQMNVKWLCEVPKPEDDEEDQGPPQAGSEEPKPILRSGWVYTGYEHKEEHQATVAFKPIKIDTLGQQFLWGFGQRFLLMSASFISIEDTAADLGLEDGEWTHVSMPSTFPVERRPIFPICTTFVNNKTKDEAYPELSHNIDEILKVHDDVRVLIHTVSYDLGNYLYDDLLHSDHRNRVYTYRSPQDRERTLNRYLADPRGVVLAPSFDRGVDLHQDDCRVIIIPKVPFGNLGDKQIKTRMYSTGRAGRIWYVRQAIRTIVQMTGRGMRSADDECTTYILDKEFLRLYAENRRLFPDWWKEAIVWDSYDPHWRGIKNLEMIAMQHLTS